ncbi:MAG: hypothetical protein FWF52_07070 [Candidatus Azobacteroides sp.]|nr:hypothetical protein [Candidatus Azobacteroides sp.]
MKNITKFMFTAFASFALIMTACSPDDNYSLGESNITQDSFTFSMIPGSDEWTYNFEVALNIKPTSVYSTEIVFGDNKSTKGALTGSHEYIVYAGTYTATCIITIPDGATFIKEQTIIIANDNEKVYQDDPASLQYALTGGKANVAGKEWHIGSWTAMRSPDPTDNRETVWWDFKNDALMNDLFLFIPNSIEPNGKFIYENNGDTHMNESLGSLFPDGSTAGSFVTTNYTPPTDATWDITTIGGKTILTIYKGFLGYAIAPSDLDKTEYEVLSFSPTNIRLVNYSADINAQIWCFELTSETSGEGGNGNWVDVKSSDNLWYGVNFTNTFYYAPGWVQLPDPTLTINDTQYSVSFPTATTDQWQNQIAFVTDGLSTTSAENYDFRVIMNASNDIRQVTVKLTQADDDNTFIFTERIDLTAGQDVVLALTDMAGKNMSQAKLVFDFGGNPDNTDVVIKDIILQTHRE